jgi:hypothetical protein
MPDDARPALQHVAVRHVVEEQQQFVRAQNQRLVHPRARRRVLAGEPGPTLFQLWPSPVVELNRAVAIGLRDGPQAGLDALAPLLADPALATYGYFSAARADFLRQLGRWPQAAVAYDEALTLADNDVERAFLIERRNEVQTQL